MKIEFYTDDKVALKYFCIEPIKDNLPNWYKNLEMNLYDLTIENLIENPESSGRTIKGCVPVLDYLTSGYVLKTTQEIRLKQQTKSNGQQVVLFYSTNEKALEPHSYNQCPVKIENQKKSYIKVMSNWIIKTPKGYSCMFYQPFYQNFEKKITLFPAIVDTDVFDRPINFPGFVNATDEEIHIDAGEPLMCIFPFKREKWEMECHYKEPEESVLSRIVVSRYRKFFWNKKSYD